MDKLYVDMVVNHKSYKVVTVIGLSKELAEKKAELNELIEKKSAELPDPDSLNADKYAQQYDAIITPLRKQLKEIRGFTLAFVVESGEYKAGQILDKIPDNAKSFEDFFPEPKEDDFSDIEQFS